MEELDIATLLKTFRDQGFEIGEKVILSHSGTVQTLLSIIMDEPIQVQLLDQREQDGVITRSVHLVAGIPVCRAVSRIPIKENLPAVLSDISAGTLGLGQIVVKHKIPNTRELQQVGHGLKSFWRSYKITGPQLSIGIYEVFPRQPFEKVGWLKSMGVGGPSS